MGYKDAMEFCEKYIAARPGKPVNARELANITGYSLYHFSHVFRAYFDMSVGEYVRKSALNNAARDILKGKSILDVSLDAGFDTPAGFSKAFKKQFGISASEYRKQNKKRNGKSMNPKFEKKSAFNAIGYYIPAHDSKIDTTESGACWYGINFSNHPKYPQDSSINGEIGAWLPAAGLNSDLNYFFGYISESNEAPEGFKAVYIPEAEYAVFDVPPAEDYKNGGEELAQNVKNVRKFIFKEWLESSSYVFDDTKMCFEFYHGNDTKLYLPVKSK